MFVACGIWCLDMDMVSKPVARHFNLPGHSHKHMEICGIYLHLGNNETRKRKEQRLIFKLYLNPWLDTSIFRATRTNTWKFAEFTYTLGTMKLEKGKNRD